MNTYSLAISFFSEKNQLIPYISTLLSVKHMFTKMRAQIQTGNLYCIPFKCMQISSVVECFQN